MTGLVSTRSSRADSSGASRARRPRRTASVVDAPAERSPGWVERLGRQDRGGHASKAGSRSGSWSAPWLFTVGQLHPDLLFSNTTPTGGDMGAHVWGPAYLRDHLLPHFRLSGWAPDWYAGFPAYQFYMVIPALVVGDPRHRPAVRARPQARVDRRRPHAARSPRWAFGKLSGLRFPAPAMFAAIAVVFLFDETFTIYGGNIASTMAGEFSFSIALSLSLVYFGVLARGLRTGRHRALAAGAARALRAVPPDRGDLRGGRHDRVVRPLLRSASLQVARHDPAGRRAAHRVLDRAVLDAAALPHRHGVRAAHRLREHALPGHLEVGRRPRRARRHRVARGDRAPSAHRHLARAHDAHLRRLDHRLAAEHVLERAAHALLLPLPVPPRRHRCRGDRAVARVDRVAAVRSRGEARRRRAHPGRRRAASARSSSA